MNHPTIFPIQRFQSIKTPFYYYNLDLLKKTIATVKEEAGKYENFHVHYAIKANANKHILSIISENRLGADCVSGGEIQAAVDAGFPADKIVFAGVGKSDWEINLALEQGISCFNVESLPELDIISQLAEARGVKATIAFRVNPNVDAHTHAKITTGLNENKFGIAMEDLLPAVKHAQSLPSIIFSGLHFHIGSQILHLEVYESLCQRINELQDQLERNNISCATINVGGGLGINYEAPDADPIPAFAAYFKIFGEHLKLRPGQSLHFELGRSIVAQCGTLIAKTLYVCDCRCWVHRTHSPRNVWRPPFYRKPFSSKQRALRHIRCRWPHLRKQRCVWKRHPASALPKRRLDSLSFRRGIR